MHDGRGDEDAIRLSRWGHVLSPRSKTHIAVYHSLTIEVVYLERAYLPIIRLLRLGTTRHHLVHEFERTLIDLGEVLNELARVGLIVSYASDDLRVLQAMRNEYLRPPGIETLYLLVTDNCNLRCGYCFINNNMPAGYRRSQMTFAVAKRAIDIFFDAMTKNPPEYDSSVKRIFFYGGEPFLNFRLVTRSVEYVTSAYADRLAQMGDKFRFSIITNGTVIDDEIARFVGSSELINIAVSIDGSKSTHDEQRPTVKGYGSFEDAIRGIRKLREVGGKKEISISATVGAHNVDRLTELIALHKEFEFESINLNPLVDTAEHRVTKSYMRRVSGAMIDYFLLARKEGIYEDRMMRKAKAFMNKRIHAYDCQGLGAQLVCSPRGQLGVCHEGVGLQQFFFANVQEDFEFHSNPVVLEWKRRAPLNMHQCLDCVAVGICGGGCAYGAWLRNGSIWSIDDRFCVHSLMTLQWLVWDLFERI